MSNDNSIIQEQTWNEEMVKDQELNKVKEHILRGWPKECELVGSLTSYFKICEELAIENDIIMRGDKIIPPLGLRKKFVEIAHEGHFGISITRRLLKDRFWWPGIDSFVEHMVRSCTLCSESDQSAKNVSAIPQPVDLPPSVWCKLGIDIIGPFSILPHQHAFGIVMMDYYSKWPEIKMVKDVTSDAIIQFLDDFCREGIPQELVTDNGPQFTSRPFENYPVKCGTTHKRIAVCHPQANGQIERFNRVVKEAIQLAIKGGLCWKKALVYATFLQNISQPCDLANTL